MGALKRQLGVTGSIAIGVAAMLGAGVFYVWKPAWERAGDGMLVALALAALVATLNGLVTTQLAISLPVSGGIYSYGRHYRGNFAGFLAGWLFLTGKTASAAAIAYVAASYLLPDYSKLVAVGLVALFSGVVISGIRLAAGVSIVITTLVISGILWLTLPGLGQSGVVAPTETALGWGVVQAAGLMFFAFAGYARMATLGEEVKAPKRTLPRAIIGALVIVLSLYTLVAIALWTPLSTAASIPDTPLILLTDGSPGLVIGLALVASLGSLLAILAGLSRTSLAMARNRELPGPLAHVSPRTGGPLVSELTVAILAIVLIVLTDPLWLVGLSSAGVLVYYAIGHWSALAQPRSERFLPTVVPVVGLTLNLLLVLALPTQSLIAGLGFAVAGGVWFWTLNRRRR